MDLQSLFYVIGIVLMVLILIGLIFFAILTFLVIRFFKKAPASLLPFLQGIVGSRKNQYIGMAVASIASFIFSKLKKRINKT